MIIYNSLSKKEIANLNTTTIDLSHSIKESGKFHNIYEEVTVYLVDDQLKES